MSRSAAASEALSTKTNPGGLDLVIFSDIFFFRHHHPQRLSSGGHERVGSGERGTEDQGQPGGWT